jgi:hypothetical protein
LEPTTRIVRARARLSLRLPIRVVCRESADYEWTEKSRLIDVNQFGAGFTLTRPVDVGRLIHLTMPLPHTLRCFDQFEPMYAIWGLVRHVSSITNVNAQEPAFFRVGVAFVGKRPPLSYEHDPSVRYQPIQSRTGQSLLWKLGPAQTSANQRREPRLTIPLEVLVETLDPQGQRDQHEYTVTETITSLGACVLSSLDVDVGRVLRISSLPDSISIFAAVRSREVSGDGVVRLGLEFIGDRWPLAREDRFTFQQVS